MADGGGAELLAVENLQVTYFTARGEVRVVDDVSFRVGAGEAFGLVGESGGGKSTIAQAILRVLRPPAAITGGQVRFAGADVLAMDDAALGQLRWKQIALVTQGAMNALNPTLRVREQIVDTIRAHTPAARREALERAAELFRVVGIDVDRLASYPHQLSGGMRQRVVIAIALALGPKLLIMDEPTTALDVVVQRDLLAQIAELRRALGFSILFVTHDLPLMLQVCSRAGIIYGGRLVEAAPAATLRRQPQHPYTRALVACALDVHGPRGRRPGIAGLPPDPRQPPPGCRFHPRCPEAFDRCRREAPLLIGRGPDHLSACHLGERATS
ncbi:MAG TPA: ABC transporter ATP-binding protein [Polyangia bacterium]|nr:ABC transporter ATP-binding protein [Polyangia bacterium]